MFDWRCSADLQVSTQRCRPEDRRD